ncbi:MAG: hypothetical protein RIB03_03575 [Henriciella sp.]|uniref:hypothetical protein n=1 Tax=Henriciella sp. TaxID=1968823 RepID=UPI00262DF57A|nr:hypothetical protein [Henriciella sp.]
MILQRLATSIRKQDWFTVAIETLIVVLGVFLGIQLGNWNAARHARDTEQNALTLLLEEAENNVSYSELTIYRASLLQQDREAALAKLSGETPVAGDPAQGMALMPVFRDMTPIHAAHDELAASGDIRLIRSADVRAAMSLYEGVVLFHDRARTEYMDRAQDILTLASPYMTLRYDLAAPLGYTAEVDWAAAGEDAQLMNAINRVMGEQVIFNERRQIVLDHVRTLCEVLSQAAAKPCDPQDWVDMEIRGVPIE